MPNISHSDTSDYPTTHTFFCYTSEDGHTDVLQHAIQTVHEGKPCTIEDMLRNLVKIISRQIVDPEQSLNDYQMSSDNEDHIVEDDEEDDFAYDGMSDIELEFEGSSDSNHCDMEILKRYAGQLSPSQYYLICLV